MMVGGIIISIVAILLIIFPKFFLRLKSPNITKKLYNDNKITIAVRIWGIICLIIGIILIVKSVI